MKCSSPRRSPARALLKATPVAGAVTAMLLASGLAQAQLAAADLDIRVTATRRGI